MSAWVASCSPLDLHVLDADLGTVVALAGDVGVAALVVADQYRAEPRRHAVVARAATCRARSAFDLARGRLAVQERGGHGVDPSIVGQRKKWRVRPVDRHSRRPRGSELPRRRATDPPGLNHRQHAVVRRICTSFGEREERHRMLLRTRGAMLAGANPREARGSRHPVHLADAQNAVLRAVASAAGTCSPFTPSTRRSGEGEVSDRGVARGGSRGQRRARRTPSPGASIWSRCWSIPTASTGDGFRACGVGVRWRAAGRSPGAEHSQRAALQLVP